MSLEKVQGSGIEWASDNIAYHGLSFMLKIALSVLFQCTCQAVMESEIYCSCQKLTDPLLSFIFCSEGLNSQ